MNLMQNTEVITALAGAGFGWLLGILSSVAFKFIQNLGRLVVFLNKSKFTLVAIEELGPNKKAEYLIDARALKVTVDVELYNQADLPKTLGNFQVEWKGKKTKKLYPLRKDIANAEKFSSLDIETATVLPKQSVRIAGALYFEFQEFITPAYKSDFYLIAQLPENKIFRAWILEIPNPPSESKPSIIRWLRRDSSKSGTVLGRKN